MPNSTCLLRDDPVTIGANGQVEYRMRTHTPRIVVAVLFATLAISAVATPTAKPETSPTPAPKAALSAQPAQQFVGISVADLAKSDAWYRNVFGMKQVFETKFDGGAVSVLETDWLMIELLHQDAAKSLEQVSPDTPNYLVHGVFKLGLFVPDLDARLAALAKHDIKPASQIYVDKVNKTRNVFIRDPDGNRWQLFERTTD